MRILVFSLETINNAGDEILGVTTEYLIRRVCGNAEIKRSQLMPTWNNAKGFQKIKWLVGTLLRKSSKLIPFNTASYWVKNFAMNMSYRDIYEEQIRTADKIMFSIGQLKYSTQNLSYVFYLINKLCTENEKTVLMSAMSPQAFNTKDWRCRQLVEAVNFPCLKMITTRDGQHGVDVLRSSYLKRDVQCDYVGDPALWIPDVYQIKQRRKEIVPYIGINIIRENLFKDYERDFTDKQLQDVYEGLIVLLQRKNWKWCLFCNGMAEDWHVIRKLKKKLNISDEHIMPIPANGEEYVNMVAQFDAVFGARLHCCITSVALGIPVVSFLWEDKIRYFFDTMKISQFLFEPTDMSPQKIFSAIEAAMQHAFDFENRDSYKHKTLESIQKYIFM